MAQSGTAVVRGLPLPVLEAWAYRWRKAAMYSPLDVELNLNAVRGAPLERMWDVLRPDGVLVTVTGDVEHLDELVEVHRRCETGRVAGKLAVAPALPLSQDLEAPPSIPGWPLYLRRRREGGGRRTPGQVQLRHRRPTPAASQRPADPTATRRR